MPRVSCPYDPASERKHGVCAVKRSGNRSRFDDRVAHEVRQRHLCGRNQAQLVLALEREQVRGELRQLARAEQRRIVDEIRHVRLGVAVLARVHVEHELRDRAMQVRDLALQDDEAAAGQLRGGIEVDEAELLAERHVIERLERELRRSAPPPQLDVRRRVRAVGNRRDAAGSAARQETRRARSRATASLASPAPSSSPSVPTSRFSASTSPPAALARPIAFERSLRVWRKPSTRI